MHSEINKPEILRKFKKVNPEGYRKLQTAKKREDLLFVEKRLNVLYTQFEQTEHFLKEARQRYDKHEIDPRRLKKLQDVLPRMRAVITRELEALLPG